ncbi:hypothetical protein T06_10714, partial [Trichinella sp. T6]
MSKGARKHHLGFYQFLQLIIDEQGKTDTMASKWMMALRGEESSSDWQLRLHVDYIVIKLVQNIFQVLYLIILLHLHDYCTSALFIII